MAEDSKNIFSLMKYWCWKGKHLKTVLWSEKKTLLWKTLFLWNIFNEYSIIAKRICILQFEMFWICMYDEMDTLIITTRYLIFHRYHLTIMCSTRTRNLGESFLLSQGRAFGVAPILANIVHRWRPAWPCQDVGCRTRANLIQHLSIFCWSVNVFIQHLPIF